MTTRQAGAQGGPAILVEGLEKAFGEVRALRGTDASRSRALGGPLALHAWQSAGWMLGLLLVFGYLAVRTYRRV